jgi:hypothetical protein
MTTNEHLERIKQKCRANLALAEKRTPGEWCLSRNGSATYAGTDQVCYCGNYPADAAYIAACAGDAEAGWNATIVAIEKLQFDLSGNAETIKLIISYFPEETL